MDVKARVFVVEDHAATANALKRFLEVSGYSVEVASDVQAALHLASSRKFDVLVCDLHLPDGNGWDLMKKLNVRRNVKGIAFSAFDGPEDRKRSRDVGFAEHLAKGSDPDLLLNAIERAVTR